MSRSVRTTSINVRVSDDYEYLRSQYDLVCYAVPESFKSEKDRYDKLHVEVKSQLSYPYYFLPHALSIYVLYPKGTAPTSLKLSFLSDKELEFSRIAFSELELHVLLKLLFEDYFRRPSQGTFVSQNAYYVYVKPEYQYRTGELKWDMCLEIKVKGHRDNKSKDATQWQSFQISNSATRFRIVEKSRIQEWHKKKFAYFQKTSPQDGIVYFNQLRKEDIDTFEGDIYEVYRDKRSRAQLDYHNHRNPEECRGKILYDFINEFIPYLNGCGLEANQQYRQVREFPASKAFGELSLAHLPTVNVLDERVNTDNPIEDYLELLQAEYPEIKFELIDELSTSSRTPTLILLDGTQEDFADGGILSDFGDDPYQTIYRTEDYISIPKQSVNINVDADGWKGEDPFEYLEYSMVSFNGDERSAAKYKFDVALKELLQKDFVINPRNVVDALPGYSNNDVDLRRFAFVRKMTYTNIDKHKVLLHFADEELHFVDLRSSSSKQMLYDVADSLGLDWDDVETALSEKNYDKEPSKYDVILSDGLAIHVEDVSETVLYEYDEIIARQSIRQEQFPIEYFRLQYRYDDAKNDTWLTFEELRQRGLLKGQRPKNKKEQASIDFYNQLGTFDDFLDDLELNHIEISYDTLTNETNMESIGTIFGLKRSEKTGKYSNRRLRNIYKRLGMFAGDKEKDVHLYQGIWYDAEHRFMVGAKQGLNETQPNAHRIRQFDILVENGEFDIELMLQTMAVTFVRHKQYTVMPYLFHLIDIYVENVLRWQED